MRGAAHLPPTRALTCICSLAEVQGMLVGQHLSRHLLSISDPDVEGSKGVKEAATPPAARRQIWCLAALKSFQNSLLTSRG